MDTHSGAAPYVFISYSRTDQNYLDQLVKHLEENEIALWTDYGIDYGPPCSVAIETRSTTAPPLWW